MLTEIYVLVDPRTFKIRYVGKSIDAKKRLRSHCSRTRTRWTSTKLWVQELKALGLRPLMRVIARVSDWETAERKIIALCRSSGREMLNIEEGGLVSKITTKKSAPGYFTYRKCLASIGRAITAAEKRGNKEFADRMEAKLKIIRSRVKGMGQDNDRLEVFYAKVNARFG